MDGYAGMGKTQLVKAYLKDLKGKGWEISWNDVLSATQNQDGYYIGEKIQERIQGIEVHYPKSNLICELKETTQKVILIFECVIFTEEDYQYLKQNFWKKNIKIIITTRKVVGKWSVNNIEGRVWNLYIKTIFVVQ